MLTGYWPPTNEMLRQFSTNPSQNPAGWHGQNWENRGYNIYSFFPEFPNGIGKGVGDFEVDYQDTSQDFWRIVAEVRPVAIITFSRGDRGQSWELESRQRNLQTWVNDYEAPFQPTPSPPDSGVAAGYIRYSTLPMQNIVDAVGAAGLGLNPFIDTSDAFGGGFLSEFMAYHGTWYHDLHSGPNDPAWNVCAGHVHVGTNVSVPTATIAAEITLRETLGYVDSQLPEPASLALLVFAGLTMSRRHLRCRI